MKFIASRVLRLITFGMGTILVACNSIYPVPRPVSGVSSTINAGSRVSCKSPLDLVGFSDQALSSSHILYQAYNDDMGHEQVWAISLEDGTRRKLLDEGSHLGLGFLKDGDQFILATGDEEALLSDLNGMPPKSVVSNEELLSNFRPYSFMWNLLADASKYPDAKDYAIGRLHSPDQQKIAVWSEGDKSLLIIDRASNNDALIVQTDIHEVIRGSWSPDSRNLAFIFENTMDNYYSQLFMVGADGKIVQPLTDRLEKTTAMSPIWSPDGRKIAFHVLDQGEWPNETIRILNLDTGQLRVFSTGYPTQPSLMVQNDFVWSPDGKWLLYLVSWGQVDIRAINTESGDIYCMTNDSLVEQIMDWK